MTETWLLLAAVLSLLVVSGAYLTRALSRSGAIAAWTEGTITLAAGGPVPALALIFFFASSSLLTRVAAQRKAALVEEYAKGGARDWEQVLANGGVATLCALGLGFAPSTWREGFLLALVGALAAATADTWATEVGGLAPNPRLITTGRIVPPGTSGGISTWGIVASLAGGLFLGMSVVLSARATWPVWNPVPRVSVLRLITAAGVAGLTGSLVDSLLGATVQAMFWCPTCGKETERRAHRCGIPTVHTRGWEWVSNDVVNFAATLVGSIMAIAIVQTALLAG